MEEIIKKENEVKICQICNKPCVGFRGLAMHFSHLHKIESKQYYDQFLKKDPKEGFCLFCNNPTNFYTISYGYYKHCCRKCNGRSDHSKEKRNKTCLEKYGFVQPSQSEAVKQKQINTNRIRFGCNWSLGNRKVQEKRFQTCLKKYGKRNALQSEQVKQKHAQTFLKRYGVNCFFRTKRGRQYSRENRIKQIESQAFNGEPLSPTIGKYERECLNELRLLIQYEIIRNPRFIGYYVDGYIKELNLIIEFDENYHFINDLLSDRDIQRQKDLIDHLNCKFFRIKESDWLQNKELIKEQFLKLYNEEKLLCEKKIVN